MIANVPSPPLHRVRPHGWSRAFFTVIAASWILNITLLLAAFFWVISDGRSPQSPEALWDRLGIVDGLAGKAAVDGQGLVRLGIAVAGGSSLLMLLGLLCGPARFRNLRSWLLVMGIACCWCGLFTSWSDLYWKGQQIRLSRLLPQATTFVRDLQSNWPAEDGELAEVGAFMAYPKRSPLTLLMLGECCLPDTSVRFSVVEKAGDDALIFGLSEPEKETWLEWRSDGSSPISFTGGLGTLHKVLRYERLDTNWFLVRYASTARRTE